VLLTEAPGLAALESQELADLIAELLDRYDPADRPPPDLPGPFDPTRDHLVLIFEGGRAYLYRLGLNGLARSPSLFCRRNSTMDRRNRIGRTRR
jgi:hypothetical protein